jgi:hypothetical protein
MGFLVSARGPQKMTAVACSVPTAATAIAIATLRRRRPSHLDHHQAAAVMEAEHSLQEAPAP